VTNVYTQQVKDAKQGIVSIRVTVRNIGGAKAAASKTKIYVDGKLLGTVSTAKLAAGKSILVKHKWNARGLSGQHTILVVVDATKVVKEANESNNQATLTVTVRKNVVQDGDLKGPGG